MVPQGYKFFWGTNCSIGVLYPKMGYGWQPRLKPLNFKTQSMNNKRKQSFNIEDIDHAA